MTEQEISRQEIIDIVLDGYKNGHSAEHIYYKDLHRQGWKPQTINAFCREYEWVKAEITECRKLLKSK